MEVLGSLVGVIAVAAVLYCLYRFYWSKGK